MQKIKNFYSKRENYIISLGVLFALIGLLFPVLILSLSERNYSVETFKTLSPIGEFLGGTTASFLALASMLFVVAAIVMQKEELTLQRDELKLTREELEKTREEHSLTNKTMKLQQFESTLFNMISIHGQLINDLKFSDSKKSYSGREVINKHYYRINLEYQVREREKYFRLYFNEIKEVDTSKETYISYLKKVLESGSSRGYLRSDIVKTIDSVEATEGVLSNYDQSIDLHANFDQMVELVRKYPEDEILKAYSTNFLNPEINNYKASALQEIKKEQNYILSHYIKSVTSILTLIDSIEFIDEDEKKKYMILFFSQFTTHEMTIIVYYANLDNQINLKNLLSNYNAIKPDEVMSDAITTIY